MTDMIDNKSSEINLLVKRKPSRKNPQLTHKQSKFVAEYLACRNISDAVVKAGYAVKRPSVLGQQLLRTPHVKALIDRMMIKQEGKLLVTMEEKINVLKDHMLNGDRDISIRAIAELNRMQGHLAPTKSVNVNLEGTLEAFDQLGITLEDY